MGIQGLFTARMRVPGPAALVCPIYSDPWVRETLIRPLRRGKLARNFQIVTVFVRANVGAGHAQSGQGDSKLLFGPNNVVKLDASVQ